MTPRVDDAVKNSLTHSLARPFTIWYNVIAVK